MLAMLHQPMPDGKNTTWQNSHQGQRAVTGWQSRWRSYLDAQRKVIDEANVRFGQLAMALDMHC